jgi:hypothetical protein
VTDLVASNGRIHDELIGIISEFTEESSTS